MNQKPDPHVYFIRPITADGPIKVGHSIHVPMRLREFNKWSPIELEIAAMVRVPNALDQFGYSKTRHSNVLERRFHLRYADYRLHHEWFAAHPLIHADIQSINAGTFDIECLPAWERATNEFIRRHYAQPHYRQAKVLA